MIRLIVVMNDEVMLSETMIENSSHYSLFLFQSDVYLLNVYIHAELFILTL